MSTHPSTIDRPDAPTPDEVTATVRQFIVRLSGRTSIEADRPLISDGILDSVAAVQMVDYIERQFAIEVTDEDLELANFDSVQGLAGLVNRKLAAT